MDQSPVLAIRDNLLGRFGETLPANVSGLFDVFELIAATVHGTLDAEKSGNVEQFARNYGRLEGAIATLSALGLPVPGHPDDLLQQAEKIRAMSVEDRQALAEQLAATVAAGPGEPSDPALD